MKIGEVVRTQQNDVYKKLNRRRKRKRRKRRTSPNEDLTFSEIENLMKHDSYARGPGGAIRQKTWGK